MKSIFLLLLSFVLPTSFGAAQQARPSKIRGDIELHRDLKRRPPSRSPEEHVRFLRQLQLDELDLEREEVVLYVQERLTAAEIAALAAQGVEVAPDLWVPPVGRHALGFHLAEVPYDRLVVLEQDARIVRVDSIEVRQKPLNDAGGALIHVDDVHSGTGVTARDGSGVKVAVADSGLDVTHPDLPTLVEAYDVTDGVGLANWGTNVQNHVSPHGTHVTGTAVGTGLLSGGQYVGAAPGASLYFYKIGNDTTSNASISDEIEAIDRAVSVGADVFSMSYGGISTYNDGTEPMEQAIDSAVANGVTVFISAGNEAQAAKHYSNTVPLLGVHFGVKFTVSNLPGSGYVPNQFLHLVWIDNGTPDDNVRLRTTLVPLGPGESLTSVFSGISPAGTEVRTYQLITNVPFGTQKTYDLEFWNDASSGPVPLVHCYVTGGNGTFDSPDERYTVGSPAVADGAIAVAAWVHRSSWTSYENNPGSFGETVGGRASFSSKGPRVDGFQKPDIAAPGSATISLRDSNIASSSNLVIDNDGLNLDGSGPANYLVAQGTSMACPMAAGVGALLLEENPDLTPAEVRSILAASGTRPTNPNISIGHGLIDARYAVQNAHPGEIYVDATWSGVETGAPATPFNTLLEGLDAAGMIAGSTLFLAPGTYSIAPPHTVDFAVDFQVWGVGPVLIQ